MPLHQSGLTSRRELDHPGEKMPVKTASPAFEHVLKYNPNHDPKNGRFAASGGGRRGGTAGPPTENAFGNEYRGGKIQQAAGPRFQFSDEQKRANYQIMFGKSPSEGPVAMPTVGGPLGTVTYQKSHVHGASDGGYGPSGGSNYGKSSRYGKQKRVGFFT